MRKYINMHCIQEVLTDLHLLNHLPAWWCLDKSIFTTVVRFTNMFENNCTIPIFRKPIHNSLFQTETIYTTDTWGNKIKSGGRMIQWCRRRMEVPVFQLQHSAELCQRGRNKPQTLMRLYTSVEGKLWHWDSKQLGCFTAAETGRLVGIEGGMNAAMYRNVLYENLWLGRMTTQSTWPRSHRNSFRTTQEKTKQWTKSFHF